MIRALARSAPLVGGRGLLLAVTSLAAGIPLVVLSVLALPATLLGLLLAGPLGAVFVTGAATPVRALANRHRRWAAQWSGVEIPVPYREPPTGAGVFRRGWTVVTDPATWRDLLWLLLEIPVGLTLGLVPACLLVYGVEGVLGVPLLLNRLMGWYGYGAFWPIDNAAKALLVFPQGAAILLAAVVLGPRVLRLHALVARSLLAPTRATVLRRRVAQLAGTRAETVDAHATELRRIERDLHDGAQARLVSLGMSIGLAEELLATDPEAARRLLSQARSDSSTALAELRGLVRGIHPPVLAERGLAGAVRALALAVPLPVRVEVDLEGRLAAPVESAAYFAVAEALANVAKHAGARQAWVRLAVVGDRLVMAVGDDGAGGADPAGGTGLRGIGRRLAAFDGTMTVCSPPGGPTVVNMELPCEWSSPRTSPSSGRD